MQKNKGRTKKFRELLADFCEVPQDVLSAIPVYIIRGRNEIEISGCTGILTCGSRCIVLAVDGGKETFRICGDALQLGDFRDRTLCVRGYIRSMAFGEGENHGGEDDA